MHEDHRPALALVEVREAQPLHLAVVRLERELSERDIDLDQLRFGSGAGVEQLRHALELVAELSEGKGLLAIDHLDDLLERLNARDARALLGVLRGEHQRSGSVRQLLVGRVDGRLASALRDPEHPLYRAGDIVQFRRPRPHRFIDDLAIGRPWTDAPVELVGAAAELADGAPAYVWRTVDTATQKIFDGRQQMASIDKQMFLTISKDMQPQKRAQLAMFLAKFHAKGMGMGGGHGDHEGRKRFER